MDMISLLMALLLVPTNPQAPLTIWTALVFIVGALTSLLPTGLLIRQHLRGQREWRLRDAQAMLALQLDDPPIRQKVEELARRVAEGVLREHDAAPFAHLKALERYPNMDQFNGALARVTVEVAGVRALVEIADRRRGEDSESLRRMISEANAERRQDMQDLKENVARAVGARGEDR